MKGSQKASLPELNARRGRESSAHLIAKIQIGETLLEQGFTVFYELLDCDVLAINGKTKSIVSIEVESSRRNVLRNITRNIGNGTHAVAILSLTDSQFTQVTNIAQQSFDVPVQAFTSSQLSELLQWVITHLNHKP